MDCYYTGFGVSTTLIRTFVTIIVPLVLMILSAVFYFIYYSVKEGFKLLNDPENYAKFRDSIIITNLVIVFLFHPKTVSSSFSLFQCTNLGDDKNPEMYSTLEPQLKCYEGQHLNWVKYLGVPSIILWVVIIPLLMTLALWRYKAVIDRPEIMQTYGFLTKGYRSEFFYWEMVIMFRKSVLIISSLFMDLDPFLSGLNVMIYLFIWYIVQLRVQPFYTHTLNKVEEYSLLTQFFYIYFSLYYVVNNSGSLLNSLMVVALIIVYISFHLYFFFIYAREKIVEVTQQISEMSEKMKHPILAKVFSRLADMKMFSFIREWLIEQKKIVETAIQKHEDDRNAKLEHEIKTHHTQKLVKEEIKTALRESQRLEQVHTADTFLSLKKRNKDMQQAALKFVNALQQNKPVSVNMRMIDIAEKIKKKRNENQVGAMGIALQDTESIPLQNDGVLIDEEDRQDTSNSDGLMSSSIFDRPNRLEEEVSGNKI